MMKKLKICCFAFILSGCAQLEHGQLQPVVYKNVKDNIMFTTCTGAVEVWADCYDKAAKTCAKGYQVIRADESAQGGKRELTFQCKK
jgi:hypothetical protein